MKTTLENDLAQYEIDLANTQSRVDSAKRTIEDALVRSPLDGVVVQIFSRQGERVSPTGIVKVVDMNQLRVLADVDELHVGRAQARRQGRRDVPRQQRRLQGHDRAHRPDGEAHAARRAGRRLVDRCPRRPGRNQDRRPSSMPPVLGRETRVTFL